MPPVTLCLQPSAFSCDPLPAACDLATDGAPIRLPYWPSMGTYGEAASATAYLAYFCVCTPACATGFEVHLASKESGEESELQERGKVTKRKEIGGEIALKESGER